MKKFGAGGMKWLKTFHVFIIGMWIGGGIGLGVISWAGPLIMPTDMYAVYTILNVIDNFMMLPAAVITLVTGIPTAH